MITKEKFQSLVRRILNEEIQKRVPEMGDPKSSAKDAKTFPSDSNPRDVKTKEELYAEITKIVKGINPAYTVVWDDHDDLTINGRDMLSVTITPLWEDNYRINLIVRNEDRFYFNKLNWKQVLEFVKDNVDKKNHHTGVEKARDKSWRDEKNVQPQPSEKGLPQKDKMPHKPFTNEPPSKTSNKEKDFTEEQVKDEKDLPNQPMRDVKDGKLQRDHRPDNPNAQTKKMPHSKLVAKRRS